MKHWTGGAGRGGRIAVTEDSAEVGEVCQGGGGCNKVAECHNAVMQGRLGGKTVTLVVERIQSLLNRDGLDGFRLEL